MRALKSLIVDDDRELAESLANAPDLEGHAAVLAFTFGKVLTT